MLQDHKILAFLKTHSMLDDDPSTTMSAAQLKAWWDSSPEEVRVALNAVIDDIIALYATKSEVSGIVLGQIPDNTITIAKQVASLRSASVAGKMYAHQNAGGL